MLRRIVAGFAGAAFAAGAADPASAQGQISGSAFNPAVSLILDGKFSAYSADAEAFAISGFLLGEEVGPPAEGLSLSESELTLSANVDDRFYGFATTAFELEEGETAVELEEAWIQTLALPAGFGLKAGRFFSDIGYHNVRHPHSWDFVDAPLAYQAMLGTTFADTGLQLRWIAPTELFLELGAELVRGESFPAAGAAHDGVGAWTLFARIGGDIGTSHSWRAGASYLSADAQGREAEIDDGLLVFSGESQVALVDFVWKWAERGNPRSRNFVVQAEYLRREEDGTLEFTGEGIVESGGYDGTQDGFYLQGIYQFRPRWRVGLRYDRLEADNEVAGISAASPLTDDARSPSRISAMLDFSHSEFSRLRLQLAEDRSRPDSDSQLFLQYVMSLGSHGAHQF